MRLPSLFLNSRRGAVAPMLGVCVFLLTAISGGAVEYSNYHRAYNALQKAADAAALSAARHYHETNDAAAAQAVANRILEGGAVSGYVAQLPAEIAFDYNDDLNLTSATVNARAVGATSFMRLVGVQHLTAEVGAYAERGGVKDVYIYFLLDVTVSMIGLIQAAGLAMTDFEAQMRVRLEREGVEMGRLFVKVGFFRDLRHDPVVVPAWEESPVYDMADPAQRKLLSGLIMSRLPIGGMDLPESSAAAVAHALTAPIENPLEGPAISRHVLQVIAMWTDTHSVPLGPEDLDGYQAGGGPPLSPEVDDLTVKLYNALRRNGQIAATQATLSLRSEDHHYGSRDYGCCKNMADLRTEWHSRGTVPLASRYLALFSPRNAYPWREMANWEGVVNLGYLAASSEEFIDGLVRSVVESGVELRIAPPRRPES